MKSQINFRMFAVLIALGAALLLAGTVNAQEITNTYFDDGPNVAAFPQPTPPTTAADLDAATLNLNAVTPIAMIATPVVTPEAVISLVTPVENWMVVSLLLCIAFVAVYALLVAKRAIRILNARANAQANRRAALS
jgi:hypothetical protein